MKIRGLVHLRNSPHQNKTRPFDRDLPSYNLGQNKMRNNPPLPPDQWWVREQTKTRFFLSSLKWGEGGGGLIFFIYFDRDFNLGQNKMRNNLPPPPPISRMSSRQTKTRAFFFHHWNGGRGGLKFFICFDWDCRLFFMLIPMIYHVAAVITSLLYSNQQCHCVCLQQRLMQPNEEFQAVK